MDDFQRRVESFITDHPDTEDDLHALLALQEHTESWTFDDTSLDSGRFGELVARDIVTKTDDGEYKLADSEAIREVLSSDADSSQAGGTIHDSVAVPGLSPSDKRFVVGLVGVLGIVIGFRSLAYPAVFREELVVLSANDPYFYRYWVDQLLAESTDLFDTQVLQEPPLAKGEPLLVVTLWWFTTLLGGTQTIGGHILAWYPVVSALLSGGLVYLVGSWVFADRRICLASVAMFALVPVHGFRASIGFADHHAFDYLWLTVTVLALVLITYSTREWSLRNRRVWSGSLLLVIGLVGQTLAWDASPILLGALGAFLAVRVISDVWNANSPAIHNAPILVGVFGTVIITHLVHTRLGWHTEQVAYAPGLVLLGGIGVVVVAELVYRASLPAFVLVGFEGLGAYIGWQALERFLPTYAERLVNRLVFLVSERPIAEMAGLFDQELGTIFGPILLFGFVLVLGFPYLVWFVYRGFARDRPEILVVGVYAVYFFGLALFQIRFTGELSPFISVFAGVGFVHLAAKTDILTEPDVFALTVTHQPGVSSALTRSNVISLFLLVLLVGSLSLVQIPIKTNQLAVQNDQYAAMTWMKTDSDDQSLSYPDNYVFSNWGANRMYNYFVNGESESYGFAQANYHDFLRSDDEEEWFEHLGGRAGYIVIRDSDVASESSQTSLGVRFVSNYGSGTADTSGYAHYRVVYSDQDRNVLVLTPVRGAILTGKSVPNQSISAVTTVPLSDEEFRYFRHTAVNADGNFSIRVAYPGKYDIGNTSVRVPESAVANESTIRVKQVT